MYALENQAVLDYANNKELIIFYHETFSLHLLLNCRIIKLFERNYVEMVTLELLNDFKESFRLKKED